MTAERDAATARSEAAERECVGQTEIAKTALGWQAEAEARADRLAEALRKLDALYREGKDFGELAPGSDGRPEWLRDALADAPAPGVWLSREEVERILRPRPYGTADLHDAHCRAAEKMDECDCSRIDIEAVRDLLHARLAALAPTDNGARKI